MTPKKNQKPDPDTTRARLTGNVLFTVDENPGDPDHGANDDE